jgi:uncharacterized protein YecE (DUF72 family)
MGKLLIGCSGWNYPEPAEKGGWVGTFYPNSSTKFLRFYSQFFDTAEMDSIFYERFYNKMGAGTFIGMANATPEHFEFSLKVPETITHKKKLNVEDGALKAFEEYLDKIAPLKNAKKLGALLFQLPPSFTVAHFRNIESFLQKLPTEYEYAVEFRHPSWKTEGPWEMLKHYNIAAVMTDSGDDSLRYLSESIVTADHAFIRFHGRKHRPWYDYLYKKEELEPWADKARAITKETKVLRVYYNNHPMGKAVANALHFKEMLGEKLSKEQVSTKERVFSKLKEIAGQRSIEQFVIL